MVAVRIAGEVEEVQDHDLFHLRHEQQHQYNNVAVQVRSIPHLPMARCPLVILLTRYNNGVGRHQPILIIHRDHLLLDILIMLTNIEKEMMNTRC